MAASRIVLLTTGGTVAATTTADGAVPALAAADLVPDLSAPRTDPLPDISVTATDLMSVDSSAMTATERFRIVGAIADALADPDVTGVVVTHGTDTMEETAYLADLFHTDDRPVVFTGAQFPADAPNADGPRNIEDALRVAADPSSRGKGTLVVLGGRMWSARGIFKVSTDNPIAFDTAHPDLPRPVIDADVTKVGHARVDAFTLYPGVSPGIIAAAVSQNAAGIVLAATGSGNTHPDVTAQVANAVHDGVVVVVTSRVPYGPIVPTYGGGGGAVDLERAGAIISRWLRAPQARIALAVLLGAGYDAAQIAEFFHASDPTID